MWSGPEEHSQMFHVANFVTFWRDRTSSKKRNDREGRKAASGWRARPSFGGGLQPKKLLGVPGRDGRPAASLRADIDQALMGSKLPPLPMHRAAAARQGLPAATKPVDFLQRLEELEKKNCEAELWPAMPPAAAAVAHAPAADGFAFRDARDQKKSKTADNEMEKLALEIQNDIARARMRNTTPPEKHVGASSGEL